MSYPLWFGGDRVSDGSSRPSGDRPVRVTTDQRSTLGADDAALIARVKGGDVGAFEGLFRELHPPLVRFACTCGVTEDEADEIVVEVFASVWDGRDTWTPMTSVAAYFFRATRNRALNMVRDAQTEARYLSVAAQESEAPLMGTMPESPDRAMEHAEQSVSLWQAIAALPERQRVLLTLRWRDGLSIEEIAAVLQLAPGATRTALTRAVQALRRVLPEDFR